MLRGNPPPNIPFFLFFSISFLSLFKKNLKILGGGPPLKYDLDFNSTRWFVGLHTQIITCNVWLVGD